MLMGGRGGGGPGWLPAGIGMRVIGFSLDPLTLFFHFRWGRKRAKPVRIHPDGARAEHPPPPARNQSQIIASVSPQP